MSRRNLRNVGPNSYIIYLGGGLTFLQKCTSHLKILGTYWGQKWSAPQCKIESPGRDLASGICASLAYLIPQTAKLFGWRNSRPACIPKYESALWMFVTWGGSHQSCGVQCMTHTSHFATDVSHLKSGCYPDADKCSAVRGLECTCVISLYRWQ
jgi:hypothetical protein